MARRAGWCDMIDLYSSLTRDYQALKRSQTQLSVPTNQVVQIDKYCWYVEQFLENANPVYARLTETKEQLDRELANSQKYYGEEKMSANVFLTTFFNFADDCS